MKFEYFDEIINELVASKMWRKKSSTQTQSSAIATLSTRLRPIEWVDAEIRIASEKNAPEGHMALTIQTAKKKSTEKKSFRDIAIAPCTELDHINQHIRL